MNTLFWLTLLSFLESIQLTVLLVWFLGSVAVPTPLKGQVLPEWQYLLRPEWEVLIFRFFVVALIAVMAVCVICFRKHLGQNAWQSKLKRFIAVEAILVFLLLSALFKKTVYADRPALAGGVAVCVMVALVCNKLFWPRIRQGLELFAQFIADKAKIGTLRRISAIGIPILIILILDVPNVSGVVARFFVGEQFHHNDSFMYGPAQVYLTGGIPNVDIISQYGAGVSVVLGQLMKIFGGLSYESGFRVLVYASITYYVLCFVLLKRWLGSLMIALAGVLFMIKVQMFNTGVYPLVFTYGSATVARYWFDIIVMLSMAAYVQTPKKRFLALGALACGAQLFYLPTDGIYVTAAFEACLLIWMIDARKNWGAWIAIMLLPFISAFAFLWMFLGKAVFTAQYWYNAGEFVQYFLSGFGVTPIYGSLLDKQYLASLMGFVIPAVYVLTLLVSGTMFVLDRRKKELVFVVFLCLYGLGSYHYYVARSAVTSYYVVAVPYVMVLCFWAKSLIDRCDSRIQTGIKIGLLSVCVWALLTNQNFISYPNRLNLSSHPLTDPLVAQPLPGGKPYFNHLFREFNPQLKVKLNSLGQEDEKFVQESDFATDEALIAYYAKEGDFSVDASLIDRLTGEKDAVPLISSFEIKILMQAKRRPYFYYYPLIISHPMTARNFVNTSIYTKDQLKKTFDALDKDKPPYIFMEKIFLTNPVPSYFYDYYPSFMLLRDYVLRNYVPHEYGHYLVALKYVQR